MKFDQVHITNFKGITQASFVDLPSTIVVAGPNGCGKSTVFDALRLWKSAYAGYQGEEVSWWLQEFGLHGGPTPFSKILQSPERPLTIQASISLTDSEKSYLVSNAPTLIREAVYREVIPGYGAQNAFSPGMPMPQPNQLSSAMIAHEHLVQARIAEQTPILTTELSNNSLSGSLTCLSNGQANKSPSIALEMVFSLFDGNSIGIIDYHGPHRTFAREEVGGINLQIQQYQQQRQQSALYNSANKYSGVKGELASAYIRDLIASKAGAARDSLGLRLSDTLDELFRKFFPGKTFKGVEPVYDGSLKFNVETQAGTHDINDLSSGEKELLYGYLRLRNYAPRNSIILLDEPELHLNPRLTDGLVDFYHRHIGKALNNQLWMVTHSDMILRQAVGRDGYKVFHMLTAGSALAQPEQALEVEVDGDVKRAIIDLVGDLAAYKPGAKLVFLEGGGNTNVDEYIISNIFPDFSQSVNLITSGSKSRIRQIDAVLERASASGAIVGKYFAITDLDGEIEIDTGSKNILRWDRYHIENYLLDAEAISRVIVDLNMATSVDVRIPAVLDLLREAARKTLPQLVRHELEDTSSKSLMRAISARTERTGDFQSEKLYEALQGSRRKIDDLLTNSLSKTSLSVKQSEVEAGLNADLNSGEWINTFRGRDVLKTFLSDNLRGVIRYEVFRDFIIAKMRDVGIQPVGMKAVIDRINEE